MPYHREADPVTSPDGRIEQYFHALSLNSVIQVTHDGGPLTEHTHTQDCTKIWWRELPRQIELSTTRTLSIYIS